MYLAVLALVASLSLVAADAPLIWDYDGYNNMKVYSGLPNQTYVSSDLVSPLFQINAWTNSTEIETEPLLFAVLAVSDQTPGPMAFSTKDLSLVWASPMPQGLSALNARVQTYKDDDYITYYGGGDRYSAIPGPWIGSCIFINRSYQVVFNITPQDIPNLSVADPHECEVTDDDTVLLSLYYSAPDPIDLTSVDGPVNGTLFESGFQEIDPETMEPVFTWWAHEHFDVNATFVEYGPSAPANPGPGYDWFHCNSVQKVRLNQS